MHPLADPDFAGWQELQRGEAAELHPVAPDAVIALVSQPAVRFLEVFADLGIADSGAHDCTPTRLSTNLISGMAA